MYWETEDRAPEPLAPAAALDVAFPLRGRALPAAYAAPLAQALEARLPDGLPLAELGLRVTHIPAEGHGWQRAASEPVLLPRRARLVIRAPRERAGALEALAGATLDVGEPAGVTLGAPRRHELPAAETLYAPRVLGLGSLEEEAMLAAARERLEAMGAHPRRMLCGRSETLVTPQGRQATRSLLVDGMGPEAGLRLQAEGLGTGRCWGCGLFIPHKAVV